MGGRTGSRWDGHECANSGAQPLAFQLRMPSSRSPCLLTPEHQAEGEDDEHTPPHHALLVAKRRFHEFTDACEFAVKALQNKEGTGHSAPEDALGAEGTSRAPTAASLATPP